MGWGERWSLTQALSVGCGLLGAECMSFHFTILKGDTAQGVKLEVKKLWVWTGGLTWWWLGEAVVILISVVTTILSAHSS